MEDKLEDEYWHPLFGGKDGLLNPILRERKNTKISGFTAPFEQWGESNTK